MQAAHVGRGTGPYIGIVQVQSGHAYGQSFVIRDGERPQTVTGGLRSGLRVRSDTLTGSASTFRLKLKP